MPSTAATKTDEMRVRRMAERQGLALRKSRRRDPLATDFGSYWIVAPDVDRQANDPAWTFHGSGRPAHHFPWQGASLDECERFLRTPPDER